MEEEISQVSVIGDWAVEVGCGHLDIGGKQVKIEAPVRLSVSPPERVAVDRERYDALPLFDQKAPGWKCGARLMGCISQETSVKGALEPDSLMLYREADDATRYEAGRDYEVDLEWATLGRVPGGRIGENQAVFARYCYGLSRIDAVVVNGRGDVFVRTGKSHVCVPRPPAVGADERALAHPYLPGRVSSLTDGHLFPIERNACERALSRMPTRAVFGSTDSSREAGGSRSTRPASGAPRPGPGWRPDRSPNSGNSGSRPAPGSRWPLSTPSTGRFPGCG